MKGLVSLKNPREIGIQPNTTSSKPLPPQITLSSASLSVIIGEGSHLVPNARNPQAQLT